MFSVITNNANKADENKTKIYTFDNKTEMDEFAKKNETETCFGLYFSKVNTLKYDYEVVYSYAKFRDIDTNLPIWT